MGELSLLDGPFELLGTAEPVFEVEDALKKLTSKEKLELLAGTSSIWFPMRPLASFGILLC